MLKKVSSAEVSSYNPELRQTNDERESQILIGKVLCENGSRYLINFKSYFNILLDYDRTFSILKEKGIEENMELPPLFELDYIDHGSLTAQNRNDFLIKSHLRKVLDFIDDQDMYDLLYPCRKGSGGFRINPNDHRIPSEIRDSILKCTVSFTTTIRGKSAKARFLNSHLIDPTDIMILNNKVLVANKTYDVSAASALENLQKDINRIGKGFVHSVAEGFRR